MVGRGSRTREKLREFFHGSRPTDLALIFRLCSFLGPYRSPLVVGPPSRRYGFLRFCAWKNRLFPTAEPAHRRIRFLRLDYFKVVRVSFFKSNGRGGKVEGISTDLKIALLLFAVAIRCNPITKKISTNTFLMWKFCLNRSWFFPCWHR